MRHRILGENGVVGSYPQLYNAVYCITKQINAHSYITGKNHKNAPKGQNNCQLLFMSLRRIWLLPNLGNLAHQFVSSCRLGHQD